MSDIDSINATQAVQEILKCKWALSILAVMSDGQLRPSEIERSVDGLSHKVLHQRLAKMTKLRIIDRVERAEKMQLVEYHLTPFGTAISNVIADIRRIPSP